MCVLFCFCLKIHFMFLFFHNLIRCHPWTGECICKAGWDGQTCSRPCPTYTFGLGCRNVCTCKNDAHCDPVNGTCVCLSGIDPAKTPHSATIQLIFFAFFFRSNNRSIFFSLLRLLLYRLISLIVFPFFSVCLSLFLSLIRLFISICFSFFYLL